MGRHGVPSVVQQYDIFDTNNSTAVALSAGATFTGDWTDTTNLHYFLVTLKADQQGDLYVERSADGINVGKSTLVTDILVLGEGQRFADSVSSRFIRLRYVNGAIAQTIFRLRLRFSTSQIGASFQQLKQAQIEDTMAMNTLSVLSGEDQNGLFQRIRATEVGALMISDFLVEVSRGNIPSYEIVRKSGAASLTQTVAPVTLSGVYQTPIANTALEFVSDSANDTSAGSGAQEITIVGLAESGGVWSEVTQTLETNGATPVSLSTDLIRLYDWYVSRSGTYATTAAFSHAGNLTIRAAGAGATWATIPNTPLALGGAQIGAHTIPSGKTGFLRSKNFFVDTSKSVNLFLFQRPNADDVSTPFSGVMRLIERETGLSGGFSPDLKSPIGPFVGPCDIIPMGVVSSGTSDVSIEYALLMVDS